MLDGDDEAIHSSTIAQQPQVWSIKEHHHPKRLSSRRPSDAGTAAGHRGDSLADHDLPVELGPSLNGHLPVGVELNEQTRQDTGNSSRPRRSRHSPPSSPPRTPTRVPPPVLLASYVHPSTGSPAQSVYSTWVEGNDATASVAPEVERREQFAALLTRNRASSSRDDPGVGYANPYGVSSPGASWSNPRPSSSRNSFDGELMENTLHGHSGSGTPHDFADTTTQDIILTGKVCWHDFNITRYDLHFSFTSIKGVLRMGTVHSQRKGSTVGWYGEPR